MKELLQTGPAGRVCNGRTAWSLECGRRVLGLYIKQQSGDGVASAVLRFPQLSKRVSRMLSSNWVPPAIFLCLNSPSSRPSRPFSLT